MNRTLIGDLRQQLGETVKVQGWVKTVRDQKRMQFLILRDHTGAAQVTVERARQPELAARVSALAQEAAVTVTGRVIENPQVRLGGLEIQAEALEVVSPVVAPLPFDPFGSALPGLDLRFDWRFLDLRRPEARLIFQVQTTAEMAMRQFWVERGFVEIHTPKLMGAPSESGAELFRLDYFGRPGYLAQSPQFYKQMAMAAGFDRVFEIAPVFRADPSFTTRHTTEFTSVDMEMSWIESHQEVMALEEEWLEFVLQAVKDKHGEAIRSLLGVEVRVPARPFPQIPMADAVSILKQQGYVTPAETRGDLDPQGERLLGDYVRQTFDHEFVFVTDYPISVRPFYHMRYAEAPGQTLSFDLLWKGLEITTGAQREHRYDILSAQALEKGLSLAPIRFYLDMFKYGCAPHGGYGFGLARMLMVLLNLPNVREANFLFRAPNRLEP